MAPTTTFFVKADWDEEACVWYISDTNVPGLSLEAETTEALLKKLDCAVPELLALNGMMPVNENEHVPYEVLLKRFTDCNHAH